VTLRRFALLVPSVALVLLAGMVAAPATASPVPTTAPAAGAGVVTGTSMVTRYGVIVFDKNHRNALRSRLLWRVWKVVDGDRHLVVEKSWRAGSGFGRTTTDPCVLDRGWLPNGWYRPKLYTDYPGSLIKGRAIYLGDHRCADGTWRTDLFIHTEQGAGSVQCADAPGDQPCRWEYPTINDYRSLGCVKLRPADMRELYDAWTRFFRVGYTDRVRVHVVR
jgi:hypothetical protein